MVICQICNQQFKRITRTHSKKHGLTTEQYKNLYPNAETISDELRVSYGKFFRENNPMKSVEMKLYFSKLKTGVEFSTEHRAKISKARKGVPRGPHSNETRSKISSSNKAAAQRKKDEGWVRPPHVMSEAARKRASDRMKGNKLGRLGNHNKGKKLNLSDEQRRNRSAKRVEFLAKNKGIKSGTEPELKFIDFLTEREIEFEHQCPIHTPTGSWLYDFWLPEMGLFVEIDGEFWHSPKKAINRDRIKNKMAFRLNKPVVRISTDDRDFNRIFLSHDEIWKINWDIISMRKARHG